ncbi:uncharacterized protein LOC126376135 isoform X3 [Pectinophora gossypiella]|uniref:uncharacterized protein LOC126376135 isoform X3 n=1 Tax=Pectinophora gossypiella TaxID=13191 RepID=UPI00214ED0A9|nr:uncharacterized protein LOC126376135 isoform X3 [Pectinophora gossypiella]
MGNHHSHEPKEGGGSGLSTPRAGSRRGTTPRGSNAGSEHDKSEKPEKPAPTSMVPVEKLAKLLTQRSQKEDGINGITEKSFTKYLFPVYPELARAFYRAVHRAARCKNQHVPAAAFRAHCERVLAMLDDTDIVDTYVRMFALEDDENTVTPDGLRSLLHTSYKLSMDHYPEGPQTCLQINNTLSAVVNGCFNKKDTHSVGFVVRWLMEHCHRLIFPIHRRPSLQSMAGPAGVRGARALGAAVQLARARAGRQPLPASHAGLPRAHAGAAACAGAARGAVRALRVARDAPVLGRARGRAHTAAAYVRGSGAGPEDDLPEHVNPRLPEGAPRRFRPAQAAADRARGLRHSYIQERALCAHQYRGVGLRRPGVPRDAAGDQEVAGAGGGEAKTGEAVGRGLDRAPRPLPAGAGRPPAVQQLRQLARSSSSGSSRSSRSSRHRVTSPVPGRAAPQQPRDVITPDFHHPHRALTDNTI